MQRITFTGTNYDEVKRLCGDKVLPRTGQKLEVRLFLHILVKGIEYSQLTIINPQAIYEKKCITYLFSKYFLVSLDASRVGTEAFC